MVSIGERYGLTAAPDFELHDLPGGLMRVTRTSTFTGKRNTMDLAIDLASFTRWRGGNLIQTVFPDLTDEEREFLMSGATPEEWANVFGSKGEE